MPLRHASIQLGPRVEDSLGNLWTVPCSRNRVGDDTSNPFFVSRSGEPSKDPSDVLIDSVDCRETILDHLLDQLLAGIEEAIVDRARRRRENLDSFLEQDSDVNPMLSKPAIHLLFPSPLSHSPTRSTTENSH